LKNCQNYNITAIPYDGREQNAMWYGARDLTAIRYGV
jgi:hypothetical protein